MAHTDTDETSKFQRAVSRFGRTIKGVFRPTKHDGVSDVRRNCRIIYEGFLRKRSSNSMLNQALSTFKLKWRLFYVILTEDTVYYFHSEDDNSYVGKFSLYGYNQVLRVPHDPDQGYPDHAFGIQHACRNDSSAKTYYFSTTKADEVKTWMVYIREALVKANETVVQGLRRLGSSSDFCELEEAIYKPTDSMAMCEKENDSDIESDASDYEKIDEGNVFVPDHGRGESPPALKPRRSHSSSSAADYIDINDNKPHTRPLPEIPVEPLSNRRKGSLPPLPEQGNDALCSELKAAVKQLNLKDGSTQPKPPPPPKPKILLPRQDLPASPSAPLTELEEPRPRTPPVKPTLCVKPQKTLNRLQRIYWRDDKAEANRCLRAAERGVFVVRSSDGNASDRVLTISSGPGESPLSVRINFFEGQCSLKRQDVAEDWERFQSIEELVSNYTKNPLLLKDGTLAITLLRPHENCVTDL